MKGNSKYLNSIPFPAEAEAVQNGELRAGNSDLRLTLHQNRPHYDPYEKDSVRQYESINFNEDDKKLRRRVSKSKTTAISTLNHDIDAVVAPPTASETL